MRVAVVFGQFGAAADPTNLPHFRDRLSAAGAQTILVQHTDTQKVYDYLRGYPGPCGIVGASLGAGVAPIMAGYLHPQKVQFVGGFQPSDWDPVMHDNIHLGLKAVTVPANVLTSVCFRNPVAAATGGLGHAIYLAASPSTKLTIIERADIHPGDFGEAQNIMFDAVMKSLQ